ncbi:MAG: phosphatidate cytidylyltransferase [Clostridiales bacterium]|nr:phosphatidate cytidylyltransferase [Clostridiales bacterium]
MKTRIITSIIALAVFAGVLLAPPIVFTAALAAIILMMVWECGSAAGADIKMRVLSFIEAAVIMLFVYNSFKAQSIMNLGLLFAAVFVILLHMGLVVWEHGKKDYRTVLSNGFLTAYVTAAMSCVWLMKEQFGISGMLLIFVCAWMTDTCAYFTGRAAGKHKLIPHVSPNKTVEGSIGGVVGAMLSCIIYLAVVTKGMNIITVWGNIFIEGALVGLAGGILSQIGDLCASAIKRDAGIKDFGWIFPGHGGFMDRFDSVMFIAPVILAITACIAVVH